MKNTLANAQSSVEESSRAQESAAVGKEVVQELVTSMNDISTSNTKINEQLEKTNTKFKEIVTIISKISELTKVIHDIVFQTKLLSFNASVEAARAGEHGKGFSVVAEEVGALAEKSGKAAQEISAVVDSSVQKVKESIEQMNSEVKVLLDDGKLKVSKGVESANRCNGVLTELSKNVTVVNQMVQEIVENFKFQSEGVQEISKAMTQLNDVTQQNAVGSNRTASFARALGIESQSLLTVVGELESTVSDGRSNSNQNSISNAA
jgi:methyl-accepting chemotaxis protein